MKLADFGLAIEVQGEQQAWFGKLHSFVINNSSMKYKCIKVILYPIESVHLIQCRNGTD